MLHPELPADVMQQLVNIEDRMNDVKRRYGRFPQSKWDKNLELKAFFEQIVCASA